MSVEQLELLARPVRPAAQVVLSYGLGVDSTALLLRWLTDPSSRDFELNDLLVVTAMTGDEHPATGALVAEHVLPRLAAARVRYVQVARAGPSQRDGIVVLDDSAAPAAVHLGGAYALSDELHAAGTLPQVGGARLCSVKSKGWVIDRFLAGVLASRRFRHAIGYEDSRHERSRARRDRTYDSGQRSGWYPLIEWGWDRERCLRFIASLTGVDRWPKSACVYCPFTLTNRAGLDQAIRRFQREPDLGVAVLAREHHALCLNPRQGLIAGRRLRDALQHAGAANVVDQLERHLDGAPHALYEVRRLLRPRRDDPDRVANASRHLRVHHTGGRASTHAALARTAAAQGLPVDTSDVAPRAWLHRVASGRPGVEHFFVAGTAGAQPKGDPHFERWWHASTTHATHAA